MWQHSILGEVEGMSAETMLLLWSMKEKHNPDSKFKLYFDTLPEKFKTGLSLWNDVFFSKWIRYCWFAIPFSMEFNPSSVLVSVLWSLIDLSPLTRKCIIYVCVFTRNYVYVYVCVCFRCRVGLKLHVSFWLYRLPTPSYYLKFTFCSFHPVYLPTQ